MFTLAVSQTDVSRSATGGFVIKTAGSRRRVLHRTEAACTAAYSCAFLSWRWAIGHHQTHTHIKGRSPTEYTPPCPCRLCPHTNDPWGYAVEPLMPDRSKVRSRPSALRGFKPRADGRGSLPGRVCMCKRTRDGVTPEEDPNSLKKLSWSHTGRGPIPGQLSTRAPGTVQTRYRGPRGATEGAGGVFIQ